MVCDRERKAMSRQAPLAFIVVLALAGCLPQPSTAVNVADLVATSVGATLAAQAPAPPATQPQGTGGTPVATPPPSAAAPPPLPRRAPALRAPPPDSPPGATRSPAPRAGISGGILSPEPKSTTDNSSS